MKKILFLALMLITLTACNSIEVDEMHTETQPLNFEIPETLNEVSNSGAITVNGEEISLS